jgi:hypothetical protein
MWIVTDISAEQLNADVRYTTFQDNPAMLAHLSPDWFPRDAGDR